VHCFGHFADQCGQVTQLPGQRLYLRTGITYACCGLRDGKHRECFIHKRRSGFIGGFEFMSVIACRVFVEIYGLIFIIGVGLLPSWYRG
jgi:hypothetical protein